MKPLIVFNCINCKPVIYLNNTSILYDLLTLHLHSLRDNSATMIDLCFVLSHFLSAGHKSGTYVMYSLYKLHTLNPVKDAIRTAICAYPLLQQVSQQTLGKMLTVKLNHRGPKEFSSAPDQQLP